jgi:hypothetical protein
MRSRSRTLSTLDEDPLDPGRERSRPWTRTFSTLDENALAPGRERSRPWTRTLSTCPDDPIDPGRGPSRPWTRTFSTLDENPLDPGRRTLSTLDEDPHISPAGSSGMSCRRARPRRRAPREGAHIAPGERGGARWAGDPAAEVGREGVPGGRRARISPAGSRGGACGRGTLEAAERGAAPKPDRRGERRRPRTLAAARLCSEVVRRRRGHRRGWPRSGRGRARRRAGCCPRRGSARRRRRGAHRSARGAASAGSAPAPSSPPVR